MKDTLYESNIHSLQLLKRGKVRDIYIVDDDKLLVVTSDRISSFDVVLNDLLPDKGRVLTQLTKFWFTKFSNIVSTSLTDEIPTDVVSLSEVEQVRNRSMVVKSCHPLPIEAVVRGYISGVAWELYKTTGEICGVSLPPGLKRASKLPGPIFTPAIKNPEGKHDENISFSRLVKELGSELAGLIRSTSLEMYTSAAKYALTRGIIIADTKFEFGIDKQGSFCLIDEVLTPDSSRFWNIDSYQAGKNPLSYDKQLIRDWLHKTSWNKQHPAPHLPEEIIKQTADKYRKALQYLTSK